VSEKYPNLVYLISQHADNGFMCYFFLLKTDIKLQILSTELIRYDYRG